MFCLGVQPEQLGGLIHSQRVLLALTQAGVSREEAYRVVQDKAMAVWAGEGDFLALLKADPEVKKQLHEVEGLAADGTMTPLAAARRLIATFVDSEDSS